VIPSFLVTRLFFESASVANQKFQIAITEILSCFKELS
jgi:hypothetical protein